MTALSIETKGDLSIGEKIEGKEKERIGGSCI